MSIRLRLLVMCVMVAILPALPLTYLVQNLLEKSFNVGLSTTVSDALESGMAVSRTHMTGLQNEFEANVAFVTGEARKSASEFSQVAARWKHVDSSHVDGYFVASPTDQATGGHPAGELPDVLSPFTTQPEFLGLIGSESVRERPRHQSTASDLSYFETENKAVQLALWQPPGSAGYLFYRSIDPEFLTQARQVLAGSQILAQLRLAQDTLSRSFFYPFMIVYGIVLAVVLVLALIMAERMSAPVRRLSAAAVEVAGGNWQVRLKRETGGEIGRLIDAFNLMVSRLDTQQRRLLDMEKIAGWREMARHLAHEIKNPLLPIRLAVQEMRDQYRGDDGTYREFLVDSTRVVEDELEHLNQLVKEFSAFAKMPGLSPTVGSLDLLVADVAKLYPQVETQIETDSTLTEFSFDSDQMRRVLVNLFDNAVNVVPDANQAKVSIAVKRRGDGAALVFSDNGPGIAAEHIARVFDPYFTTRTTGTGLGLALTKSIVVMHGGTVEVKSPEGGGAAFTVTLPLSGLQNTGSENQSKEG